MKARHIRKDCRTKMRLKKKGTLNAWVFGDCAIGRLARTLVNLHIKSLTVKLRYQ